MHKIFTQILSILVFFAFEPAFAKEKSGGAREKIISREGRSKTNKSKTKIDFGDAEIDGARKNPMASMLTNNKAKKDYDMVPIRTDWKPEMIQSASSLDAGRVR
jgi:hypothetical protein